MGQTLIFCLKETVFKSILSVLPIPVATPCKKQCLNAAALDEESDYLDDEEITVESVQKMYEELYADWLKKNKMNVFFSKEIQI